MVMREMRPHGRRLTLVHRAADDHLQLGGPGKGGTQHGARSAAIPITFLCNGVALFVRKNSDKRW
jgi:hypothetical protein